MDSSHHPYIYCRVSHLFKTTSDTNLSIVHEILTRLCSCEAVGQDRKLVKELLQELYFTLHIRNIIRALDILERRWEVYDRSRPSIAGYAKEHTGGSIDEVDSADWLDFIPY